MNQHFKSLAFRWSRYWALVALLLVTSTSVQTLHAQEPEEASEIARGIFRASQHPYEVTVQFLPSKPAAGTIHFVISPTLLATGEPVEDATILIVVDDEDGTPTYQSFALNTPQQPNLYQANFLVKRAGEWTTRVEIESEAGKAEIQLPLSVIDRNITGGISGTLAFFLVVGALLGICVYLVLQVRRRTRSRQAPD